ncbi:hypothetical protein V8F06_007732 [Rhypophila decipiens]
MRLACKSQLLRTPFPGGHLTRGYHGLPQRPLTQSSLLSRPRQNPFTAKQAQRALSTNPDLLTPTPTTPVPPIEAAITAAEHLISTIHSTSGLPWYLTLPLLALSLNLVTRWPITVYTNGINRRRTELKPLLTAAYRQIAMRIKAAAAKNDPHAPKAMLEARATRAFTKTYKRLFKAYGVQRWKDYLNLGILPIWLLNIQALKRLTGGPPSLEDDQAAATSTISTAGDALDSGAITTPALDPTTTITTTTTGQQIIDTATTTTPFTGDPTFITEGCLWFVDLTAPDPYTILPTLLSFLMVYNVLPSSREGLRVVLGVTPRPGEKKREVAAAGKWSLKMQRALLLVAAAIGPLTANLPAAIHLYWISSTAITVGMKNLAEHLWPIPKDDGIKPCKPKPPVILPRREKKAGE